MMKRIFYGWWIVFASFFIAFYAGGTIFYAFTAFFEPIVKEYGWSYTQVSIAFSLRGLGMGVLAPLLGFFVDHFGVRKLVLFGVIIMGFGLVLIGLTKSLIMLYGAFLLLGLGAGGCTTVVLMTAVANWFRKSAGKALGVVACGFGAGGAIIPLSVWLIDVLGWRATLMVLALGVGAFGIPLSLVIRDRPEQYGYFPDGGVLAGSTLNSENQAQEEDVTFSEILRGKPFWLITFAESVQWLIVSAVITHIMPYLGSIGMSRTKASFVATAMPLLSLIGRLGFGWLGDIADKRYVMAGTYCLTGLGMLAFSYSQVGWAVLLFLLLFSPAYAAGVGLKSAILREYFGRASFGKALGILLGISALAGLVGPALAGMAFDYMGHYHLIWLVFCGLPSLSITAILCVRHGGSLIRSPERAAPTKVS